MTEGGAAGWRELLHFHDLPLHGELRKGLLLAGSVPELARKKGCARQQRAHPLSSLLVL